MRETLIAGALAYAALLSAAAAGGLEPLRIPEVAAGPTHVISIHDLAELRDIDSICVSADGERFAILVRQGNVAENRYRTAWFAGQTDRKGLLPLGDGGDVRTLIHPLGFTAGEIGGSVCHWSPDGTQVAYLVKSNDEVQLWRSSMDGPQQQISHNEADVRDFTWIGGGRVIAYTVGRARALHRAEDKLGLRNGFNIDEYRSYSDVVYPRLPLRPLDTELNVWIVAGDGIERRATEQEAEAFRAAQRPGFLVTGTELNSSLTAETAPKTKRNDGAATWFAHVNPEEDGLTPNVRLTASLGPSQPDIPCRAAECTAQFMIGSWWHGNEILFQRWEGVTLRENSFYAWNPRTQRLRTVLRTREGKFSNCGLAKNRLICLRETPALPRHVATIDISSGNVNVLVDVNPEFRNIELGKVERVEWELPADVHKIGFPQKSRAYVIYPPSFDPKRKYPVFIAPYTTGGFLRGDVGNEHPLYLYAAFGFVVINSEFPFAETAETRKAPPVEEGDFSSRLGFPRMTMFSQSTFRALDTVAKRGFIDLNRVGIGGVSHGAFIPLYMVQREDRITALSVGGPTWTTLEPFTLTRAGREAYAEMGVGSEWPTSSEYWSQLDLADHVRSIEAPILFHYSDSEAVLGAPRLLRNMDDAHRPYDAFIYTDELHEKTQPAHIRSLYERNLDWFRFWLQDIEDPAEHKQEQYARWRQLRKLQCQNERSVRDYCMIQSRRADQK